MSIVHYVNNRGVRARLLAGERVPWIERKSNPRYVRQLILSIPPWVLRRELMAFDRASKAQTLRTGVQHSIGHIVPLKHPLVCGLTVPWNLRIEPLAGNLKRGNAWHGDWQSDFFSLGVGEQGVLHGMEMR